MYGLVVGGDPGRERPGNFRAARGDPVACQHHPDERAGEIVDRVDHVRHRRRRRGGGEDVEQDGTPRTDAEIWSEEDAGGAGLGRLR